MNMRMGPVSKFEQKKLKERKRNREIYTDSPATGITKLTVSHKKTDQAIYACLILSAPACTTWLLIAASNA